MLLHKKKESFLRHYYITTCFRHKTRLNTSQKHYNIWATLEEKYHVIDMILFHLKFKSKIEFVYLFCFHRLHEWIILLISAWYKENNRMCSFEKLMQNTQDSWKVLIPFVFWFFVFNQKAHQLRTNYENSLIKAANIKWTLEGAPWFQCNVP